MKINKLHSLREVLVQAIEESGYNVSGPTDVREAEHGEPPWVCNAREVLAETSVADVALPGAASGSLIRPVPPTTNMVLTGVAAYGVDLAVLLAKLLVAYGHIRQEPADLATLLAAADVAVSD
jgi:hypothetical protein